MKVADRLITFCETAQPTPLVRRIFALSLLDWTACAIAGVEEPVSRIARDMILQENHDAAGGGGARASVVGAAARVPARAAALVNGATSHALDYDDTHFAHIGHASVAVIPAALAVAEEVGATGTEFAQAALIGLEASVRFGVWLGRPHYQAGFHMTGTAGAIGAALAAAKLMRLNAEQTGHALGLVASRAGGIKAQFGTMGKPMNAGYAAANGVEAALFARAGMTSTPDALDGMNGFAATHYGAADDAAWEGMGAAWLFEDVSHKLHACCHGTHAMIEALRTLDAPDPDVIEVAVHPRWLTVCNIPEPTTGLEAKFSLRLCAAMALTGRDTSALASFSDAACTDPALVALHNRVQITRDETLTETAARVRVDGVEAHHDLTPLTTCLRDA
ncbi:MAG: MmgE/PrpD family protein [Rhodobacteraceae bacterium]|nr:MmgE/PrpD family protein [Paracoccaceae bacterium]